MHVSTSNLRKKLTFIPFVMTNGMNLFPIFILSQLFIQDKRVAPFILPLVLFYCFKTTILFIVRIRKINSYQILLFSIWVGIAGSMTGFLSENNFILQLMTGILLGISSGLMTPAFTTVSLHQKFQTDHPVPSPNMIITIIYASVLLYTFFKIASFSLTGTFVLLGINLALLYFVIQIYDTYVLQDETPYPSYSVYESILLFSLGFFTIFIIKSAKKLGFGEFLLPMLLLFSIISFFYLLYLARVKPDRKFDRCSTILIIYKGMLTNFIFVFCTFFMLLYKGKNAFYLVYIIYLIAVLIGPMLIKILKQKIPLENDGLLLIGLSVGYVCLVFDLTFYLGVFITSLFAIFMNQDLTKFAYQLKGLPVDSRIMAKFRLNNIGSIIHQVLMVAVLFLVTYLSKTVTVSQIFTDYSMQRIDLNTILPFKITKCLMLLFFIGFFPVIKHFYTKQKNKF